MKRVRFNGKSLSKFQMAFEMGCWQHTPWDILCDVLSYDDMKNHFIDYCVSKGLTSKLG